MVPPLADTTLVILAGGLSTRMGTDKASIRIGGRSLLEDAVARLSPVCSGVLISVHEKRDDLAWPQVVDAGERAGALGGIASALAAARTDWIFAAAVDMPLLDETAMRAIAAFRTDATDAVIPRVPDPERGGATRPEPLAGFYRTSAAAAARDQLATGTYAIKLFLGRIAVRWLELTENGAPSARAFTNVNTPEDLGRLDV